MARNWIVPGVVVKVHDGDTVTLKADLGWHIAMDVVVRVAHIDAPELATDAGKQARAYALNLLPVGSTVTLTSHQVDKYGRTLGTITLPNGKDFAQWMVEAHMAVPYEGGAKTPAPAAPST